MSGRSSLDRAGAKGVAMDAGADTAARIIQAAEALFAEQGFKDTTLRQITGLAGVNLAAVNYHFGSKSGLIRALAVRALSPLCHELDRGLARLEREDAPPGLEPLLELMAQALRRLYGQNPPALAVVMRLLEQVYLPSERDLQLFLRQQYGARLERYLRHIRADAAPIDGPEFFWRCHFLLGSVIFTLSRMHTLSALQGQNEAGAEVLEQILAQIIPVISAGLHAPPGYRGH
jgi:AcrR family transcriptional regulator